LIGLYPRCTKLIESHSEATIYDSYPGGHVSALPDSGVNGPTSRMRTPTPNVE